MVFFFVSLGIFLCDFCVWELSSVGMLISDQTLNQNGAFKVFCLPVHLPFWCCSPVICFIVLRACKNMSPSRHPFFPFNILFFQCCWRTGVSGGKSDIKGCWIGNTWETFLESKKGGKHLMDVYGVPNWQRMAEGWALWALWVELISFTFSGLEMMLQKPLQLQFIFKMFECKMAWCRWPGPSQAPLTPHI